MEEMKRSSIDFEEPKNSKSSSSRTHDAKASSSRRVESDGENPREDMKVEKQSQSITGEGKMEFGKDIETWLSHIRKKPNLGRAFLAEVKSKDVRTRKGDNKDLFYFHASRKTRQSQKTRGCMNPAAPAARQGPKTRGCNHPLTAWPSPSRLVRGLRLRSVRILAESPPLCTVAPLGTGPPLGDGGQTQPQPQPHFRRMKDYTISATLRKRNGRPFDRIES